MGKTMVKIAVVTATRAEYGLLAPVIKKLRMLEDAAFCAELIVTGTHLSKAYGNTVDEIKEDGVRIDHTVEIPLHCASPMDISANQAQALVKFTLLFASEKYDAVMILGDRYEMLAVAAASVNAHIPIFHISGGDVTEGAVDDCIRHCITKMSYLHFTGSKESRRRVIQMGEEPGRVFCCGSTGIDNTILQADMGKQEALGSVGLTGCRKYALGTYHPATLQEMGVKESMGEFLEAVRATGGIEFIVTMPNADEGGEAMFQMLRESEAGIRNLHVFTSLGVRRYLSLMRHAEFVIGNSSSGIIETPAFHIPTVNIGDRQKGRLRAASVIDCAPDARSIQNAIQKACSSEFKKICREAENPYGSGNAAEIIVEKSMDALQEGICLQKHFYDIDFMERLDTEKAE